MGFPFGWIFPSSIGHSTTIELMLGRNASPNVPFGSLGMPNTSIPFSVRPSTSTRSMTVGNTGHGFHTIPRYGSLCNNHSERGS